MRIGVFMCVCVYASAYKEKVKELPLVSLFCACLNPQTIENPTYKAEGKITPTDKTRVALPLLVVDLHRDLIPQMQWTWAGASSRMWR